MHAVGHFGVFDGGFDGVVVAGFGEEGFVLEGEGFHLGALDLVRFGGDDVGDGNAVGTDGHGLVGGGEEAVGEVFEAAGGIVAVIQE